MSQIQMFDATEPSTPVSGSSLIWMDSATKTLKSKDSNGVVHNYGLADTSTITSLSTLQHTCVIEGCIPSVNALDATKFDISAGTAIFTDSHTNPTSPTIYKLTYAGSVGNVNTRLATNTETLVSLNSSGVVVLSDFPDGVDQTIALSNAVCGGLIHQGHSVNEAATPICGCINREIGHSLSELGLNIGFINLKNGNVYYANGANLQINKTAGWLFGFGINRTSSGEQNVIATPIANPSYISYTFRDGIGGFIRSALGTSVVPGYYDNGTNCVGQQHPNGVVGTKFTVHYLFFSGSFCQIQIGQHLYDDMASCIASINNATLEENPVLLNASFRGWLVCRGDATNLSDPLKAQFFSADKFGNRVTTGGIKYGTDTLQTAYNNGSIEPEIKINSLMGAVVIQDSDVTNGTNLFEVKNANGVKAIFDVAPTQIDFTEKVRLSGNGICYDDMRVGGSLRVGANPAPTFGQVTGLGNIYLYKYGASTLDNLYATIQMPHKWKQGTDIVPHIHWTTEDSNAGNIVWTLEYTWANYDGTFGATTTVEITAANSTAYKHHIDNFATISGTGKTISSVLILRLSRNGAAAADTYASTAALIEFDIHYQIDSHGSDNITSKTN